MADELTDSYRILQLEPGAALPQIKRSYRNLVKTWHPDHFAPGSAMEIKAQEKLKEINLAYERLCKNRGAEAAHDPDATGEAKKARKPAASDDDEKETPKRSNSRKAEEEPVADPAAKPRGRRVGDLDDEPEERPTHSTEGLRESRVPLQRRLRVFWREKANRRKVFAALVVAAGCYAFAQFSVASRLERWLAGATNPAEGQTDLAAGATGVQKPQRAHSPAGPERSPSAQVDGGKGIAAADSDPKQIPNQEPAATAEHPPVFLPFNSPPSAAGNVAQNPAGDSATRQALPNENPKSILPASSEVRKPAALTVAQTSPRTTVRLSAPADSPVDAPSEGPGLPTISETAIAQRFDVFTVGSTKEEVVAVQGEPDAFSDTDFQFGSSHVTFQGGRVVSWQDGSPKLKARKPLDRHLLGTDYFTVGSRMDEVVAVEGKPDRFSESTYQYGTSAVFFRDGHVVSWVSGSPSLKARTLVEVPSLRLRTFSVGSRKDEVVVVQGMPDTATDTSFIYGTSTVFFTDGRVTSWVSGSPALRTKKP